MEPEHDDNQTPSQDGAGGSLPAVEAAGGTTGAEALLERAARRRAARMAQEELKLPVPTWAGELVAVYKPLDPTRAGEYQDRQAQLRSTGENLVEIGVERACDFLAEACVGMMLADETGTLHPVTEQGAPVGYDTRLAEKLGVPAPDARELIRYLMGNNAAAIDHHSEQVVVWMRDTSKRVDGQILGESVAGGR